MRRLGLITVVLALALTAPAGAAVTIVNGVFVPNPPTANANATLDVDVTVGTPPYIVEFFCCGIADTAAKTILDSSPETQGTSGHHSFTFTAAPASASNELRTVKVRVSDSNGDLAEQSFIYQPVTPTPSPTPSPGASPSPTATPQPQTLPDCPTSVSFQLILARTTGGTCWRKRKAPAAGYADQGVKVDPNGTFYEGTGPFVLNGIPFPAPPAGRVYVLAEPTTAAPGGQIGLDSSVEIKLKTVTIFKAPLLWKLPTGTTEGKLASFTVPAETVLGNLKVNGSISVLFRKRAGTFATSFPITVTLPSIFKPAPGTNGTITGATEITTDDTRGVSLDGGRIEVANAAIGKVALKNLCLSYLSANVSSQFAACSPPNIGDQPGLSCGRPKRNQERFDGSVVIQLPTTRETQLGAYAGVAGGKFAYAGGFGDNLGVPLIQGITLERAGFGLCVQPVLVIRGDIGFGFAKGLVRGDGSLTYTELANRNFQVEAFAAVRVADIPVGDGRIRVDSTGTADFDLNAVVFLAGGFLQVRGGLSGFIQGPVPGFPRPFAFSVDGRAQGCLLFPVIGLQCIADALVVVSSVGTGGCAGFLGAKVGATFLWKKPAKGAQFQLGSGGDCGFADRARAKRARQAGGALTFPVPPGSPQYVAHIQGAAAPPKVRITSPSGKVIESSLSFPTNTDSSLFVLIENPETRETSVFLHADAAAGDWRVEALPGSTPITGIEFQGAEKQADADVVRGRLRRTGRGRAIDVTYRVKPGETVSLDVTGEDYQQTLSTRLKGRSCKGRSRCATVRWTPSFSFAGKRTIEATIVDANGAPIATKTLARFRASAPKAAPAVPALRMVRRGTSVFAIWGNAGGTTTRYGAYAVLGDGRRLGFTAARTCQAWEIKGVARRTPVKLRLQAGRPDLQFGRSRSVRLAPRAAFGGPKRLRRASVPRVCDVL